VDEKEVAKKMVTDGYDEKVWEHTIRTFDDVDKEGKIA